MKIIRSTYYGGAFQIAPTITQKFWDELTERRKQIAEMNAEADTERKKGKNARLGYVDTTYGSGELGERPSIPDWVYDGAFILLITTSFICSIVMIYIFYRGH